MDACIVNLPLPFSIIKSKHISEVGVQILFEFSMKLAIDLFQWEYSLTDYVTELHSSPLQKSSVGKLQPVSTWLVTVRFVAAKDTRIILLTENIIAMKKYTK